MLISRRLFLTAPILYTTALYSSSVFPCEGGGGLRYCPVPLPPHDFLAESSDERSVEKFLDKKYGRGSWKYSLLPISFEAPEIPENPDTIPVRIRTDDQSLAGQYRSIELFVQRLVKVWDVGKYRIPQHAPEKYQFSRAAAFKLGEQVIPTISMRLRSQEDERGELRMIAVLIPANSFKKIEVVKQEKAIKIYRCFYDRRVYIDGKWPNGLTTKCMEAI